MQGQRTSISAQVIADSIYNESRLTTFEVTFPRFILSEFNTHRRLSRNSASSRAIPVWKRLEEVLSFPFIPLHFGKNKAGMQSAEVVTEGDNLSAQKNWLLGRDVAVLQAFVLAGGEDQVLKDAKGNPRAQDLCDKVQKLSLEYGDVFSRMTPLSVGVHKQHANRVLEPYAWHTVIVTSTHWRNFYALRASSMAQPEIQVLAIAMAEAHQRNVPDAIGYGGWHLPYIKEEDRHEVPEPMSLARISSARCARVSYLTHDGQRSLDADLSFADGLQTNGHTSPFEHPAMAGLPPGPDGGNLGNGWVQYRKMLPNEHDFSKLISEDSLLEGMKGDQLLVDFVLTLPR